MAVRETQPWKARELALLRRHYPTTACVELAQRLSRRPSQVFYMARKLGLRKDPQWVRETARKRALDPNHGGRATRFGKGRVPPNKGIKGWTPGGRAVVTQFKLGHRPHSERPIGTVRVREGALVIKLADTGYNNRDWAPLHTLIWQSAHGDVPPGHIVIFADGNRRNFAAQNLLLVSRAQNMKRNSIHTRLPKELKEAVMALGRLKRRIREKQDRGPAQPPVRDARGAEGQGPPHGHRTREDRGRRGAGAGERGKG